MPSNEDAARPTIYGPVVEQNPGTITATYNFAAHAYDVRGLPNPYLGLRSFTYADQARYAGREQAVAAAVQVLTTPGAERVLLFVTGASGSGKSSFAQAGLLPALHAHYQQRGMTARHAVMRPGGYPLASLRDALQQLGLSAQHLDRAAFAAFIQAQTPPQQVNLLVLDQFEELFTQAGPAERDVLFRMLATLPPFVALHTHLIVTLRADYLPELFAHPTLYEHAKQGSDLRAMNEAELIAAIQRPLQQAYPHEDKRFEDAVLTQLAADAAADAAYLPLLQVTLEDVWARGSLKLSAYGTLADAIQQRAEDVYAYADHAGARQQPRPKADQATIMAIFLDLIEVSLDDDPRRDVRRRRALADLRQDSTNRARLIEDLVAARLLSTDDERDGTTQIEVVNIIHESLIANWPRLQQSIAAQREALQQRVRVEQALREWQAHDRSDEYLLSGVRLAEAEALRSRGDIAVHSMDAQALVQCSVAAREAARQHELDLAQRAQREAEARADEQEQRAAVERKLRYRQIIINAMLFVIVGIASFFFLRLQWLQWSARDSGQPVLLVAQDLSIERFEVTNHRFRICVQAGRCTELPAVLNRAFYDGGEDFPVTGVDALQAASFCSWIGRRLPTLDEWEEAAGLRNRKDWPDGAADNILAHANFLPDGPDPIGQLKPIGDMARATPDGIADIVGNVLEWTATSWDETTNERGPDWNGNAASISDRLVAKGGSFEITRSGAVDSQAFTIDYRSEDLGFRCVEDHEGN